MLKKTRPLLARRTRYLLIVVLSLELFGYAGYLGQVWWARQIALKYWMSWLKEHDDHPEWKRAQPIDQELLEIWIPDKISEWTSTPWYGSKLHSEHWYEWHPRRYSYELLKLWVDKDLGNNPTSWEKWFKAHPALVWDKKKNQLVERSAAPAP